METQEVELKNKLNEKEGEEIYTVKLVRGRYKNLHFRNIKNGQKMKIRMAGSMIYSKPLVHYVEQNGELSFRGFADPRGGSWRDPVWTLTMTKEQILELIERPRKKAKSYDRLLAFLGVSQS